MRAEHLELLAIADPHYTRYARHACVNPSREAPWACLWVRKALERLRQGGVTPDAILLLGDLVDSGDAPDADMDLGLLAGEVLKLGIPVLALPGNHDAAGSDVFDTFGCTPGLHRIGHAGLLLFQDRRVEGEIYARDEQDCALPETVAGRYPGMPLIALQHPGIYPPVESSYPYRLKNADDVMKGYHRAGVVLSLSGHDHAGHSPQAVKETLYASAPSMSEAPFGFLRIQLDGRHARVSRLNLRLPDLGLWDMHCHTEFAYCATSVAAATNRRVAERLGQQGLGLAEHAFHLYFPAKEAWSFRWQHEPARVAEVLASPERGRMAVFKHFMNAMRKDPFLRIGLEVDLLGDGSLLLAPEDREGWDYLLGAIHAIDGVNPERDDPADVDALFLRDVDRLLAHPIQVLAHPFRYYERAGIRKPSHLFETVAERLAAAGVAAEINFHINHPEPVFFEACLKRGVRLALGTDAHDLTEVADLDPHLRFLGDLGVEASILPEILFHPGGQGMPS